MAEVIGGNSFVTRCKHCESEFKFNPGEVKWSSHQVTWYVGCPACERNYEFQSEYDDRTSDIIVRIRRDYKTYAQWLKEQENE